MSKDKRYSPPLKMFNILGATELRQSRMMVVLLFVVLACAIIVAFMSSVVIDLQNQNTKLSEDRVMYGFPNSEGLFVSETTIPRRHIEGFTSWFIQNFYNFTPESAERNATESLRVMSPSLRVKQEPQMKVLAQQSIEQNITQVFAPETKFEIEHRPGVGYIVSFKGTRVRATLNRVINTRRYDVKFLIKEVKLSAHFDWAVVLDDFIVQEI